MACSSFPSRVSPYNPYTHLLIDPILTSAEKGLLPLVL